MDLLELINQKIDTNQKHTEKRLDSIDANLKEHMRRSDMLEKMHKDNKEEIDSGKVERGQNTADIVDLKKPAEARKYLVNGAKGLSAILILGLTIAKYLGKI